MCSHCQVQLGTMSVHVNAARANLVGTAVPAVRVQKQESSSIPVAFHVSQQSSTDLTLLLEGGPQEAIMLGTFHRGVNHVGPQNPAPPFQHVRKKTENASPT